MVITKVNTPGIFCRLVDFVGSLNNGALAYNSAGMWFMCNLKLTSQSVHPPK